jgi:hypothetical protein
LSRPTTRKAPEQSRGADNLEADDERILAVKIFISAILALSLLGVVGAATASSAPAMHPHSFDYYDQNGVEHTGINLNLRGLSRHDLSEREEHSADARHHRSKDHHETVLLLLLDPDSD